MSCIVREMAGAQVPSGMHAHSTLTKSYGYTQYRMWYVFQMFVLLPLSVRKFSLSIWKWLLHCLLGYMWIYIIDVGEVILSRYTLQALKIGIYYSIS